MKTEISERELLNKKWGEFKVKDIFSIIEKCKCNNASKFFDWNIPYVWATNKNNWVMRFIEADKKFITKWNCVCFVCDGQGSVWYSIYKKEDFVWSTTLKVWRFEFINEFIAQFLISTLDKNRFIYSFWYKRTEERLKNEKILLPITENEEIDYEFMENYMKYLMLRKYQKYLEYIW